MTWDLNIKKENRNKLYNKTAYVIPDNPSASGYNATDLKYYLGSAGNLLLFDWLSKDINVITSAIDNNYNDLDARIESFKNNTIKLFELSLCLTIIPVFNKNYHYLISTQTITKNDYIILENYFQSKVIKELIIDFDGSYQKYKFFQAKAYMVNDKYKIYGLGVNTLNNKIAALSLSVNRTTLEIEGNIDDNGLNEEKILEIIEANKQELLTKCVPKQDIQTISQIGEDKPMTEGGFIQIKTYEETDYTYKGGN